MTTWGPEEFRGFTRNPLPIPHFRYPVKMKWLGLSETKWFHFHGLSVFSCLSETKLFHYHGIYKKNEKEIQQSEAHPFIHMNPFSRNPGSATATVFYLFGYWHDVVLLSKLDKSRPQLHCMQKKLHDWFIPWLSQLLVQGVKLGLQLNVQSAIWWVQNKVLYILMEWKQN